MCVRTAVVAVLFGVALATDVCSSNEWPPTKNDGLRVFTHVNSHTVSVIFVEVPVAASHGQYHAAIVFQGDVKDEVWTVEYVAHDLNRALFPSVKNGAVDLGDFHAGYCITKGVLHGKDYWSHWKVVATMTGTSFGVLVDDYLSLGANLYEYYYGTFYVEDASGRRVAPASSGEGVLGALDFAKSVGAKLQGISDVSEIPITTVRITSTDVSECDMKDELRQEEVLNFFTKLQEDFGNSTEQKLKAVLSYTRGPAFVYTVNCDSKHEGGKFFSLRGNLSLHIEHAPRADWKTNHNPGGGFCGSQLSAAAVLV